MTGKKKLWLILALAVILCSTAGIRSAWYQKHHIFIDDAVYSRDAEYLDLRGTEISIEHYHALRTQLPDCEILWDVPFQEQFLSNDITEITVTTLSESDLVQLAFFPNLTTVHAEGCTDYPLLLTLAREYPDIALSYQVTLGAESYPENTAELILTEADPAELLEKLQYLPQLETLHLVQPTMAPESLLQLRSTYPSISITWEKDVFGETYRDDVTQLDFSGIPMESVDLVETAMAYFPELEKLVMCGCGIDNETMAAFRERVRSDYKVVWSVQIYKLTVRTDDLTFMPAKYDIYVNDRHTADLVYCEDMICVDLGHNWVKNIDWIYGMPHLKYLILADTWVSDITPIGSLDELVYLELFLSYNVRDYSPLVGCTALEDLNVSKTRGDVSVFAQMPWLKNLWVNQCKADKESLQLLTESLPDTNIESKHGWHMGNNWRALPNYFKMRDLLEMPYYDWGNAAGRPGDTDYLYAENGET